MCAKCRFSFKRCQTADTYHAGVGLGGAAAEGYDARNGAAAAAAGPRRRACLLARSSRSPRL